MNRSVKIGICFGTTSCIITILGLMVGLFTGTRSELAVIGGLLTIAIADAFSDALAMHLTEESQRKRTRQIWEATFATFATKFIFGFSFIIPVLLTDLQTAIILNIAWGFLVLSVLSYLIARSRNENPWKVILEHILIALVVVTVTYFVGIWISQNFSFSKV